MKSEAITVVVFSRIQLERQFNSWEYGSYTSENNHIFLECLVGQISYRSNFQDARCAGSCGGSGSNYEKLAGNQSNSIPVSLSFLTPHLLFKLL